MNTSVYYILSSKHDLVLGSLLHSLLLFLEINDNHKKSQTLQNHMKILAVSKTL